MNSTPRRLLTRAARVITGAVCIAHLGCNRTSEEAGVQRKPPGTITYAADIAPIIQEHCVACHRPEQSAPFVLETFADVKKRANQIATVTQDRFMPPWLPEHGYGEFADCRRLSDQEIALIAQWVEEGAIEGDPSRAPPVKEWPKGWQLGTPDLVLQLEQPYTLPASGGDVFRNFVIPVDIGETKFVRAIEIVPGNAIALHHANLKVDSSRTARIRDGQDDEAGFAGMDAVNAKFPDGHILGWTPGRVPSKGTPGMAWRLPAGADLVLMLHMVPTGKPESIQSQVGLYFSNEPPRLHPYSLRLGSQTIDIPPGKSNYEITDSYVLPVDVQLLAIYPHAHYLARSMDAVAILPDGSQRPLIRIPQWDFNWQDEYRCLNPVELPRGTTVRMKYVYDNSAANPRNPHRPPVRVSYGPHSRDEMGDLWLQVLPRSAQDLEVLKQDFLAKELQAEIAGIEQMLRANPRDAPMRVALAQRYIHATRLDDAILQLREAIATDPSLAAAHTNLGVILQTQGKTDEALTCFRRALEADPQSAEVHLNLGLSMQAAGDSVAAMREFERAIELRPTLAAAHVAAGNLLHARGQPAQAIMHYETALSISPDDPVTLHNLGTLLLASDQSASAIQRLERATQLNPQRMETLINLATGYRSVGRLNAALTSYRAALRLDPNQAAALSGAAWVLATSPEESARDSKEAVRLAEQAVRLTNQRDVQALDSLAAAYASAGVFDKAVAAQGEAIRIATAAGATQARVDDLQTRLALYRQREAFVDEGRDSQVVQLERPDN